MIITNSKVSPKFERSSVVSLPWNSITRFDLEDLFVFYVFAVTPTRVQGTK